jgi:hypothetical protein
MGVDAEHRTLVRGFFRVACGNLTSPVAFSSSVEELKEAKHGTRNSALAIGRADTGDHSAVAVLRPLTPRMRDDWFCKSGSVNGRA